ncbi:MAG TPA: hypothetical protein VGE39_24770 [Prosthecobacter sp.]
MPAVTKLIIQFVVGEDCTAHKALHGLPEYVIKSFVEHAPGKWHGSFVVSCSEAPHLAEGDFADDLAPCFPVLLRLQRFHEATFELQVAVGPPGPEEFEFSSSMVALVAALGANLVITTSSNPRLQEETQVRPVAA